MMYTSTGYCGCGYEIWIEYLWNGKEWVYHFFNSRHEEITHCVKCGAELIEDNLKSM